MSIGFARPLALTGQIGYQIPTTSFIIRGNLDSAGARLRRVAAIQHAIPEIRGKRPSAPDFFNHLIPIVEMQFSTPVANNFGNPSITTGTINPGVI